MDIVLDLNKSVEQNASTYFDAAKKARRKIKGAQEALQKNLKKREELLIKEERDSKEQAQKQAKKRQWFEKFRWFLSSEGFLIIGGRDATTNELIIKKHTESHDLVFHTDIAGSPFFVIKTEGKQPGQQTIRETADATATFSRIWKLGLQSTDVFYVKPEQVTKKAQSGEFMAKGAFMIYGKTNYVENSLNLAIGIKDNEIMAGPLSAIEKHCGKFVVLGQGDEKASDIAKKIRHFLGKESSLDEIIRCLPSGNFRTVKK